VWFFIKENKKNKIGRRMCGYITGEREGGGGGGGGGEMLGKKLINSLEQRAADVSKSSVFLTGCIYMVFQARKTIKVAVHYENLIEFIQSVHMSGFHSIRTRRKFTLSRCLDVAF